MKPKLKLNDFVQYEVDWLVERCNFSETEENFFRARCKGYSLIESAEKSGIERRTADNYSKRIRNKVIKVLARESLP